MITTKDFRITNSQGHKLAVLLNKPATPKNLVIVIPGFTGCKCETHIKELAIDFAKAGYASVTFDPVGFGESEGSIEYDYRTTTLFKDLEIIINYFNSVFENKLDLYLAGHSKGGQIALCYACNHPKVKAVAAIQGSTSMGNLEKPRNKAWFENGYMVKENECHNGTFKIPAEFLLQEVGLGISDNYQNLKSPAILMYGTKDDLVTPEQVKDLYSKLDNPLNKLVELKDMAHDYKNNTEHVKKVNRICIEFFDSFNPS